MTASPETVTAVIPTRDRPQLVQRAVRSALGQTFKDMEVVVVVDGPDPATEAVLKDLRDDRLRILVLPASGGAPKARNSGVAAATGNLIAFLDDDDEWLPDKIQKQVEVWRKAGTNAVCACLVEMITGHASVVLPRRLPKDDEDISEYLMVRRSLSHGEGFLQTSMLLAPRELLERAPFDEALTRHQETDWILRVIRLHGASISFVNEVLAKLDFSSNAPRVSQTGNWRFSLDFIAQRRHLVTPRAYAGFLLTGVSAVAAREQSFRGLKTIFREARRNGRPGLYDYFLFIVIACVPQRLRRYTRDAGRSFRRFTRIATRASRQC